MARDFSDPKKLGFMRFLQVLFAINISITIISLVFVSKSSFTLGLHDILDLTNLVFDGVSFWLIWKRKAAARVFIIAFSLFNIVVCTLIVALSGSMSVVAGLNSCAPDIVMCLYFLTSRRAKAILTEPFSIESRQADLVTAANLYRPRTLGFWRDIAIYFCVFSVVGHWMEAGYCTLIRFGILPGIYDPTSQIWSDWLYPFPVYGFGAVACILLFYPVKCWLMKKISTPGVPLALSFLFNALVCTLIELTMGLIMNQPLPDGSLPLWDYRNMFCNFMGQVCLQNAIGFGLVATLITWVVYPLLEKFLLGFSKEFMTTVFIAVIIGFAILFFFYCINLVLPESSDTDAGETDAAVEVVAPPAPAGGPAVAGHAPAGELADAGHVPAGGPAVASFAVTCGAGHEDFRVLA